MFGLIAEGRSFAEELKDFVRGFFAWRGLCSVHIGSVFCCCKNFSNDYSTGSDWKLDCDERRIVLRSWHFKGVVMMNLYAYF